MKSIFLPGLALLLSLTSTALAQENGELGRMWTFENPPLAYLEKEYGFKPDQEWFDSLRLGSLRLGGEDVLLGFGTLNSRSGRRDWIHLRSNSRAWKLIALTARIGSHPTSFPNMAGRP
jgi:hypothetical protein